jgi:hypothetical protein
MAFAINSGSFSSASIWDTGVVPTGSEAVYANGFTVQVDINTTVGSFRSDTPDYYLPNTAVPIMTSATSPSGIVTASSQASGFEGWRVFDRNLTTLWQTAGGVTSATLAYQFPSNRIIKRYSFRAIGATTAPRNFTFEAFDGASWITLDTQTAINVGANGIFTSALINTPNTAYLSYRLNVTAVNGGTAINFAELEMTESTSSTVGNTTGGAFNLSTPNITVNTTSLVASTTGLIVVGAATGTTTFTSTNTIAGLSLANCNIINHSGNCNLIINGNLLGVSTSAAGVSNSNAVSKAGTGSLQINGNITSGAGNAGTGINGLLIGGSGNVTVIGDVIERTGGNTNACHGISHGGTGKLTVVGSVIGGGNTSTNGYAISSTTSTNLEVTGNVTGGGISAAINKTSGAIIVTGNVVSSNLQGIIGTPTSISVIGNVGSYPTPSGLVSAIAITNTATIDVTGFVAANSTSPAITAPGLVSVNGLIYNVQQWQGVFAPRILIGSATTSILYQNFSGSSQLMYAGTAGVSGQPTTNNVRFGTPFGVDNTFVGTCRIPTPNTVRLGAATDNTTGTLIMTPDEFIEELGVSTRPIAVRLQNVSTVATTGDQVASYGV